MHEPLRQTSCPKCGKVWDPKTDDLVQLFNHSALHTWLEKPAGSRGTFHGAIRTAIPLDRQQAWIRSWINYEIIDINQRMGVLTQ